MSSIAERIARTRRQQTRVLAGAGQASAPSGPARATTAANDAPAPSEGAAPQRRSTEHTELLREFAGLLPAARRLYGYEPQDIELITQSVVSQRAGALPELQAIVKQWRLDLVSHGLDLALADDGAQPLVAEGVARRARIQFRIEVMGETTDENGLPYTDGVLDWAPEPRVWTVPPGLAGSEPPAVAPSTVKPRSSKRRKP